MFSHEMEQNKGSSNLIAVIFVRWCTLVGAFYPGYGVKRPFARVCEKPSCKLNTTIGCLLLVWNYGQKIGLLMILSVCVKAAVHWERPGCALAQSSPNLTWTAMGLHAGSARPQRVSGSARTDSQRTESARNPIASHVNFGDDSALNALTRT